MYAASNSLMREFDRLSAKVIPEAILMENAGRLMADRIRHSVKPGTAVHILAGPGHNGGDALVAARHLGDAGIRSTVYLAPGHTRELRDTMLSCLDPAYSPYISLELEDWKPLIDILADLQHTGPSDRDGSDNSRGAPTSETPDQSGKGNRQGSSAYRGGADFHAVLVDGWLGSGINRPIAGSEPDEAGGTVAALLRLWNEAEALRFALDVPSGLSPDYGRTWPVLRADITLAVQYPRDFLYSEPAREYCGQILVIRPGFPGAVVRGIESDGAVLPAGEGERPILLISPWEERSGNSPGGGSRGSRPADGDLSQSSDIFDLIPAVPTDGHKGIRGKVEVLAGSPGMAGAALLSSRGCAAAGAGMVRLVSSAPEIPADILETDPAVMYRRDFSPDGWADAYLLGPGWGRSTGEASLRLETMAAVFADARRRALPCVVDADGLYTLKELLEDGWVPYHPDAAGGTRMNQAAADAAGGTRMNQADAAGGTPMKSAPVDAAGGTRLHTVPGDSAAAPAWSEESRILPEQIILTPHPGEAAAMLGISAAEIVHQPLKAAAELASRYGAWVLIKSSMSWISSPWGSYAIFDGRLPALGTAGSGDVLAGVISGLLVRSSRKNKEARDRLAPGRALSAALLAQYYSGERVFRSRGWFSAAELTAEVARYLGEVQMMQREEL